MRTSGSMPVRDAKLLLLGQNVIIDHAHCRVVSVHGDKLEAKPITGGDPIIIHDAEVIASPMGDGLISRESGQVIVRPFRFMTLKELNGSVKKRAFVCVQHVPGLRYPYSVTGRKVIATKYVMCSQDVDNNLSFIICYELAEKARLQAAIDRIRKYTRVENPEHQCELDASLQKACSIISKSPGHGSWRFGRKVPVEVTI